MVHAERKGPGRRLRHVGHDNYFVGGISDEVSPAARYRRRRRSSDRAGRVWPARGDGRRGIAASGVRSAGVRPLLQRRERQADARGQCDLGQPARRLGGGLARRRRDRLERHRLGRATPTPRCSTSRRPTTPRRACGRRRSRPVAAPSRRSRSRRARRPTWARRCRSTRASRPRPAPRRSTRPHRRRARRRRPARSHPAPRRRRPPATSSRSVLTSTLASATH